MRQSPEIMHPRYAHYATVCRYVSVAMARQIARTVASSCRYRIDGSMIQQKLEMEISNSKLF